MGWAEPRGKLWVGRYRDANGKVRYAGEAMKSKRAAKRLADEKEADIRAGKWVDPDAGKMLFSTYFTEEWLPYREMEQNTADTYRSHYNATLKKAFGDVPLKDITPGKVQRWVTQMRQEGMSPGTLHAKFKALRTILAANDGVSALQDRRITENPCVKIKLPKAPKRKVQIYSFEETEQIMRALDPWYRPLVLLAAESGMRWGELMGLRVNDFEHNFRICTVQYTIIEVKIEHSGNGTRFKWKDMPKDAEPRRLALDDQAASTVAAMVKERQLFPGDRLFSKKDPKTGLPMRTEAWPEGLPLSRSHMKDVWQRAHDATGLEKRRFHDLRASHISWLLGGGADTVTVMERAGHSRLETTQVYVKALGDADQRALAALRLARERERLA